MAGGAGWAVLVGGATSAGGSTPATGSSALRLPGIGSASNATPLLQPPARPPRLLLLAAGYADATVVYAPATTLALGPTPAPQLTAVTLLEAAVAAAVTAVTVPSTLHPVLKFKLLQAGAHHWR
jgi:hypothetical protein